jgi:molybdopterin-guanine dinucleotide biosynthesis protein A
MGTDKALLRLGGGKNLLQLALGTAKAISPTPIIVGSRERYSSYGEVVEDEFADCGPLGGVHAALGATTTDLNLVLSVDMPLMTSDYLRWLVQVGGSSKELAVVPEAHGRLQSLCATYRRPSRCVIERALKQQNFKMEGIFTLISTRYIRETELEAAGFSSTIFSNINTPADLEALGDVTA